MGRCQYEDDDYNLVMSKRQGFILCNAWMRNWLRGIRLKLESRYMFTCLKNELNLKPKLARQWYKRWFFMIQIVYNRCEYDCCIYVRMIDDSSYIFIYHMCMICCWHYKVLINWVLWIVNFNLPIKPTHDLEFELYSGDTKSKYEDQCCWRLAIKLKPY